MDDPQEEDRVIPLWPEGAPGSEDWRQAEGVAYLPSGLKVVRNVTQPSLTVYPADPGEANGTAVIICPGGSWHFLSIDVEGTDVAGWLARRGVTAFVLRYRLASTGEDIEADLRANLSDQARTAGLMQTLLPLAQMDGQQALRSVRQRAAEWGIQPGRIGMLGFSAGGHFTALAALHNPAETRPDFVGMIYPPELHNVTAPLDAPPLFLLCAGDDLKANDSCTHLYAAWKAARSSAELHIYSQGGHGFGMRIQGLPSDTWIERFGDWLRVQGLCA